jgi:hypothetical protein
MYIESSLTSVVSFIHVNIRCLVDLYHSIVEFIRFDRVVYVDRLIRLVEIPVDLLDCRWR